MSSDEEMKEMVGGCCVCSEIQGWDENPLVYCDGQGCNVAVHQACYGIVTVPPGPWFCRKCESQERSARVKCDLCPSRDGALKRTDQNGWAHVVCALYIPEVRFGNVTTMEPILISLIPSERFGRSCYICEGNNRGSKGTAGACMQCNKQGCKQNFHVTCAQMQGLLCEEAGNMDNVKYCGYCQYHYSKLKTNRNVKIIPPFRPVSSSTNANVESPGSSPDKLGSKSLSSTPNDDGKMSTGQSSASLSRSASTPSNSSADHTPARRSSSGNNNSPDIDSVTKNSKLCKKGSSGYSYGSKGNSDSSSKSSSSMAPKIAQPVLTAAAFSLNPHGSKSSEVQSGSGGEEKGDSSGNQNGKGKSGKSGESETPSKGDDSFTVKLERVDNPLLKGSSHSKKDFTTLQLKEVLTPAALDRTISSSGNKFDHSGLVGGGPGPEPPTTTVGSSSSSGSHSSGRHSLHHGDKLAPPDIKPHVTLTPIPPMRGSSTRISLPRCDSDEREDKEKDTPTSKTKSPAGNTLSFHNSFGPPPKLQNQSQLPESMENTTRNSKHENDLPILDKAAPPAKRSRGASREEDRDRKTPTKGRGGRRGSANTGYSKREVSNSPFVDENSHDDPMEIASSTSTGSTRGRPGRKPGGSRLVGRPMADDPPAPTLSQLKSMESNADSTSTLNVLPTHMFGNALNPASSMAQRMVDTLSQEMEAVVAAGAGGMPDIISPPTPIVGIPFPGKSVAQLTNGTSSSSSAVPPGSAPPQTLEQLLERQWEQGSQFLMEQAQHLDIAQLLSCLNQLKQDNKALEEHVQSLVQRRDQLIAINARLSIPLGNSNALGALGPGFPNTANGSVQNGHGTPPPNLQPQLPQGMMHSSVPKSLQVTASIPSPQQQHELMIQSGRHSHRDDRIYSHSEMQVSRADLSVSHPTTSPHTHSHQALGRQNVAPYGYPGPAHSTSGVNSHTTPHSHGPSHHSHSRDNSR